MKIILINIILLSSLKTIGQQLPIYRAKVSLTDKINHKEDKEFGVGDDGINRIAEPTVKATSELHNFKYSFPISNINDYNLETPWICNKNKVKGEFVEYIYDFCNYGKGGKVISINSFFIINGYRDLKLWKEYSRIKKLKMSINNKPFAYVLLKDTYKFQSIDFPDYWFNYGYIWTIKFEIVDVYNGDKYKNIAISEIKFEGKYSENSSK